MRSSDKFAELDSQAFGTLVEPYRRELHLHCYRMLGSVLDAEDLVQETLLRAWRRRDTLENREALRAWLYKIATHVCLDALRKRPRRVVPITRQAESTLAEPIPADVNEPIWIEPYPDDRWLADDDHPEHAVFARQEMTLAFIVLLHLLPPRQRAVLILRDVLDFQANEAAVLLDMTVSAVKSALHWARSTMAIQERGSGSALVRADGLDEPLRTQLEDYVRAWETADVAALLALLKADATFSMPPIPAWYRGRATIRDLTMRTVFSGQAQGRWHLRPTRANGQPAFGLYRQSAEPSVYHAYGIQVLTFHDGQIADITTFRHPALFPLFHLPAIVSNL